MKKALLLALLSLMVILAATTVSCKVGHPEPSQSVSIGTTTSEVNSLILIAEDKGFFERVGLDVTHSTYPSGVAALDGMFKGEVDMATGSEFAFAGEVLSGGDIRSIAAISRSSIEYLVGRKDRGIDSLADLKGKIVGVPKGSRPEFALDRFLLLHGIRTDGLTLVDVPVNESAEALVSGKVDAVATWQPYINRINDQMRGEVIAWDVQEDQPSYTLLMSTEKWVSSHPELAVQFLRALSLAEDYISGNPVAAKALVKQLLKYDDAYMDSVWSHYSFSLTLDQALVVAMEDQGRWLISKNLTDEKTIPDFLEHVYFDGLRAVRPEGVNVIR